MGETKRSFFGSYEGTRINQARVYNSATVTPAMLQGNFSGLPAIKDPLTGLPFPGNQIPDSRISAASKYFFPWILLPNAAGNVYKANAPVPTDVDEFNLRIDHQITDKQRIYWRYYHVNTPQTILGYQPSIRAEGLTHSYSMGLNYDYTITPNTIMNLSIGTVNVVNTTTPTCGTGGPCSQIGKENLTAAAGIQGFQTAGREEWIGLPDSISFAGYTGVSSRGGWGDPSTFKSQSINGNASVNLIRGKHTIAAGFQYTHLYLLAAHGSCCSKGTFDFNGQYTGDGFADYLLGLTDSSSRDYPIHSFGMKSNPYGSLFINDSWKISSRITVELGLRWDHWFAKSFIRGAGGTFDPKLGKAIAAENSEGNVDLTAQPVAPFWRRRQRDFGSQHPRRTSRQACSSRRAISRQDLAWHGDHSARKISWFVQGTEYLPAAIAGTSRPRPSLRLRIGRSSLSPGVRHSSSDGRPPGRLIRLPSSLLRSARQPTMSNRQRTTSGTFRYRNLCRSTLRSQYRMWEATAMALSRTTR